MINKVIVGILVFLVVLTGGLCVYSFNLSEQIGALGEELAVFEMEGEARINAVNDELAVLRAETLTTTDALDARIGTLDDEVEGVAGELSQSVINANRVYQMVSQSVVRVSDGEGTVGSGFIMDTEARIVTAYHVVEHLSDIYVVLPDGRTSEATVTGSNEFSDVAVLELDDELVVEPATLADSDNVRIGESVVVIGNPFDLTETLNSGVVSQLDRFVEVGEGTQTRWVANLIQFDAAVNFGNSGGPLLNSDGQVIGMVIARVNPERGDGIYYAVSSNKIKRVATALIDQGSFDYPLLGVEIANLTPEMAKTRGLETISGALVETVLNQSPADIAGIEVDDVIVAIDGVAIKDVGQLNSYLGEHTSPDELVTVTIWRDTVKLEISLKIGERS